MVEAIRFDFGVLGKPEIIKPENYLLVPGVFAVDGILKYFDPSKPNQVRKELRHPDINRQIVKQFRQQPYVIDHPPKLLDSSSATQHLRGITTDNVRYIPGEVDQPGMIAGNIKIFDKSTISMLMEGKKRGVSSGYRCQVDYSGGKWNNDAYDAMQQLPFQINHVAGCDNPRAGEFSKIYLDDEGNYRPSEENLDIACLDCTEKEQDYYLWRLDSFLGETTKIWDLALAKSDQGCNCPTKSQHTDSGISKMTTTTYRLGSVEYSGIPAEFATAVNVALGKQSELQEYKDELEESARTDSEKISELEKEVVALTEEKDRIQGRADELEEILFRADDLLSELGFSISDDGEYHLDEDTKNKLKDDEDDEDDEEEEEKIDSVSWRLKTWTEANQIIPGILNSEHFDENLGIGEIREMVLTAMSPEQMSLINDFSEGDDYDKDLLVDFVYTNLTSNNDSSPISNNHYQDSQRQDNQRFDSLDTALNATTNSSQLSWQQFNNEVADNWQEPLALSRNK